MKCNCQCSIPFCTIDKKAKFEKRSKICCTNVLIHGLQRLKKRRLWNIMVLCFHKVASVLVCTDAEDAFKD